MAAPIFLIFFQSQQPVIIPVEGEPAGDDYNSRRQRRRRGLRPDPFDPWTDDPYELPLVAREMATWPPELPMAPPNAFGVAGGAEPMQEGFEKVQARMIGGAPRRPVMPSRTLTGHRGSPSPITGPPMAPVPESPEVMLARMLRRG